MKKSVYLLLLFCFFKAFFFGIAAQNVAYYFVQMPSNQFPTISSESRKDLVDFFNNGKSAAMPSAFGGPIILKELSEDYLFLQTSENTDLQIKILAFKDTTRILAVVHSAAAPLKDSRICFYSTSWLPIQQVPVPNFTYLDFLNIEKGKALGLANRFAEVSLRNFVSVRFESNSQKMVVHSSIREDIRPEILKDFEPILKDSLQFIWQNSRFNLQN